MAMSHGSEASKQASKQLIELCALLLLTETHKLTTGRWRVLCDSIYVPRGQGDEQSSKGSVDPGFTYCSAEGFQNM